MIPVSRPSITELEKRYVNEALDQGWVSSQGPHVKRFEEAWAKWNGSSYGVACSSGTNALVLALRAMGIGDDEWGETEVLVPNFTMIASAWAVKYLNAKPVFVDCGDDLNIDVNKIEEKITSKTRAIMPVHIYGRQCRMDAIMQIAHDYGLRVIEDSAEAHGVKPLGDIACFSLFANKIITAGEGGICLTNDKYFAEQMVHLRSMAFNTHHTFLHPKVGYNYRMTNLQAAFALAQVERIDEILKKREEIESWYSEFLRDVPSITLMPKRNVLWMYDILADDRDELINFLADQGIETRVFFKPMTMQPMFKDENYKTTKAYNFSLKGLYLPTYTDLEKGDVELICDKIKEFYAK